RDIGMGDPPLLVVGVEDRRPVLPADIGPLPVLLRRIVGDREEDLQQLAVADAAPVVPNLDRFGVIGGAGADGLVVGRLGAVTGIAVDDRADAVELLVHRFD